MIKSKNELIAYMDGYGDAFSDFLTVLHKHHVDYTNLCANDMRRNIERLNRAICRFTPDKKEVVLNEK